MVFSVDDAFTSQFFVGLLSVLAFPALKPTPKILGRNPRSRNPKPEHGALNPAPPSRDSKS